MAEDGVSIGKLFVELVVKDEKFGPALKQAEAEVKKLGVEVSAAGAKASAALRPVTPVIHQVVDAERKHVAVIVESRAAETARAPALGVTVGQLRQVDGALKAGTATATAATAAVKTHTAAVKKGSESAGSAAAAATNLRFQLFDVVQQLSAGQNPLMIANQQGFQIAQAFGSGPSGAAGALATFTTALGPLGGIFTAVTAALGPLVVILAAGTAAYAVLANAQMDVEASSTGARDAVVDAADKIKGSVSDIDAGAKAWERFRGTVSEIATDLAVVRKQITKGEAETAKRVEKIRKDSDEAILQKSREWAATLAKVRAYEGVSLDKPGFYAGDVIEAYEKLPLLRKQASALMHELATMRGDKDRAIEQILELGVAEDEAEEDEKGKKGKAAATKDQTAALREYDAAMRGLVKTTEDAASAAALQAAEDRGGNSPSERRLGRAMEKSRQDLEKALASNDAALAEALAASVKVGGELGDRMAVEARAAFAQAQGAIIGEFVESQDDAAKAAVDAQRAAALKIVDADKAAVTMRVDTEEHYAEAIAGKPRFSDTDIAEAARANLELLDGLGGGAL